MKEQIEPGEVELHAIYCPCERCTGFRARRVRDERLARLSKSETPESA